MDYNANINWIVAGQPKGRRLNVIKSFYVKFERKIPALVDDFCRYYAEHRHKTVVFYYDATALGSNYAVNEQEFFLRFTTKATSLITAGSSFTTNRANEGNVKLV